MNTSFEKQQGKDEWLTPPGIIQSLGQFDLDPCSPIIRPWDTAGAPSVLIAYGKKNAEILRDSDIKGRFIWLNTHTTQTP